MKKVFNTYKVRDLQDQVINNEISFSRMVETMNEMAFEVYKEDAFTKDELKTIKTDILHIYDKVSLDQLEVHKRNIVLNKIKAILGEEF